MKILYLLYLVLIFVMSLHAKKLFKGWVFMSGAGQHFPKSPYDIVRIHILMIYSDIVEYNILGDTKAALLSFIHFISKVKNGDIISTGQNVKYQNFPNLQF